MIDKKDFNDYSWHDASVEEIFIDRRNPGIEDIVNLKITWANGKTNLLIFKDVYWAKFNLNFGIVCNESILNAYSSSSEPAEIIELKSKWKGYLDDLNLHSYVINLNSSGGEIRIISKSFDLK